MIDIIKQVYFFCQMLGYWKVLSSLAEGVFGRFFWWLFIGDRSKYKGVLREHLSNLIQDWYLYEKKNPNDKNGMGIFFLCGFVIYAYSYDEHTQELFDHSRNQIDHKLKWLEISIR